MEEFEEKSRSRRDEFVRHPLETAASLLRRMEAEAGVVPDAWCSNVAMEAAVRDRQWSLASRLFDEAERRFMQTLGLAGTPNASGDKANAGGRGPGELRKTAINPMAPTALSYHLALQACASASADMVAGSTAPESVSVGETGRETTIPAADRELRAIIPPLHEVAEEEETGEEEGEGEGQEARRRTNTETRLVARALYLVRTMVSAGVRSKTGSVALAQRVCANSGSIEGAVEIRRLQTGALDRRAHDFLGQWRQRSERPRASVNTHRSGGGR